MFLKMGIRRFELDIISMRPFRAEVFRTSQIADFALAYSNLVSSAGRVSGAGVWAAALRPCQSHWFLSTIGVTHFMVFNFQAAAEMLNRPWGGPLQIKNSLVVKTHMDLQSSIHTFDLLNRISLIMAKWEADGLSVETGAQLFRKLMWLAGSDTVTLGRRTSRPHAKSSGSIACPSHE